MTNRQRTPCRAFALVLVGVCASVATLSCIAPIVPGPEPEPSSTLAIPSPPAVPRNATFSFETADIELSATLAVGVQEIDRITGRVVISGVDTAQPSIPFTFAWGDGIQDAGWFPMTHTYADTARDYEATVTAHYGAGRVGKEVVTISFVTPEMHPVAIPEEVGVTVPTNLVPLSSRVYASPTGLSVFGDNFLTSASRSTVEYVLSVAAWIQCAFANGDVYAPDGVFQQVVLRDADFGGMYSIWFTTPPSFAAGDYAFQGSPEYSSLFHEMGHNVTLNSPAAFCYGGKIDGWANAIFSETMAQIFAHATAYEIINCSSVYGLDTTTTASVRRSSVASYRFLRSRYNSYVAEGKRFSSWNDSGTSVDETFDTFMVLGYVFCEQAEQAGRGYREPLQRMMTLLQTFDAPMQDAYSPGENSPAAEAYRATLMVAALSYAFDQDLRPRFRELSFPVSDEIYASLIERVP